MTLVNLYYCNKKINITIETDKLDYGAWWEHHIEGFRKIIGRETE
jgi:hypothetical protein